MIGKDVPVLHHVEVCVVDETKLIKTLVGGFNFKCTFYRHSISAEQWVLKSDQCVFIITKGRLQEDCNNSEKNAFSFCSCEPPNEENLTSSHNCHESGNANKSQPTIYPYIFCRCASQGFKTLDSVFNVVIEVPHIDKICDTVKLNGGSIIIQPVSIESVHGIMRLCIIESKCKNVIHTLIDKSKYNGSFLPGFQATSQPFKDKLFNIKEESNDRKEISKSLFFNYVDHVALVCRVGESKSIINWYEKCFNMKRFIINSEETVEDGLVLGEEVGLRLKALEYWRCTETGVSAGKEVSDRAVLKVVIGEPLPSVEKSHVANFLKENNGPGVQHIALHCNDIVDVVSQMKANNVQFRVPPETYYDELRVTDELGLRNKVDEFRLHGILIDTEEDANSSSTKYLMQIFTFPIFQKDTFFMEVIQRVGATGFGSGNITALARSIIRYQEKMRNKVS